MRRAILAIAFLVACSPPSPQSVAISLKADDTVGAAKEWLGSVGDTARVFAVAVTPGKPLQSTEGASWLSSDTSIVAVTDGLLRIRGFGEASVMATYRGVSAAQHLSVRADLDLTKRGRAATDTTP